ncbi:MAG: ShlB/FhaC/HecB family hemolysin secretion/activation protein [Leptolyngbyaceae cyanobacterium bins.349]|nr:ShlB/FhaC/HecB family hemolysin secretion/activation protein [Leptolyngbyaceae cyanobacterium bins.349]
MSFLALCLTVIPVKAQGPTAQTPRLSDPLTAPGRTNQPPSLQPLPEVPPVAPGSPTTPPPLNEVPFPQPIPSDRPPDLPQTITVKEFQIEGPQVFSQQTINDVTQTFRNRPLAFAELLQVADVIARLYVDQGYIISGAYVPADRTLPETDAIVPIVVVGDRIEAQNIRVRFVTPKVEKDDQGIARIQYPPATRHRLQADYVRSRLALATNAPLNRQTLLAALQLLKLNPLIQDIRANLYPGTTPGQSFLDVDVVEARSFNASALLDNGRSPSIGSLRRQFAVREGNLTGLGDSLFVSYANTSGSHAGDLSYTLPINPRNGTLTLNFGSAASQIVEEPFDILDIRSRSRYLEFSYRQPILQTPTRELALGATFGRQFTRATLVDGEIPFPVPGSDFAGNTRITTLRLFQEWRSNRETATLALRSQLSVGLPLFNSTDNEGPPDARFVAWRGQAQWIKLLAPDTLLLVRGELQFADRALPPVEQFGLGGISTVRGYRQDATLGDSGVLGTAEVRIPVLRLPAIGGLLQIAPFLDVGTAWNRSGFANPDPRTLAGTGLGLRLQIGSQLTARFDWGIPLVSIDSSRDTWQERGLYFSLVFTPF